MNGVANELAQARLRYPAACLTDALLRTSRDPRARELKLNHAGRNRSYVEQRKRGVECDASD